MITDFEQFKKNLPHAREKTQTTRANRSQLPQAPLIGISEEDKLSVVLSEMTQTVKIRPESEETVSGFKVQNIRKMQQNCIRENEKHKIKV